MSASDSTRGLPAHGLPEPRRDISAPGLGSFAGEAGVTTDRKPPFVAEDEETRWLFSLNRFGIRPGLRRIRALLQEIGNPEREVPTVVVAGTNGKGSTTRCLAAMLRASGYKVGSFTSPHLLRVYERIVLNGEPIAPDRFAAMVRRLRPVIERHDASWFESLTAMALDAARRAQLDFLICETGLGGRLDATNALPAIATLLTSISLDHTRILGSSLHEIAAEKLGLLKEGAPLFAAVAPELRAQVFESAVRARTSATFLDEAVTWRSGSGRLDLLTRRSVIADWPADETAALRRNQALAWLCVEEMAERGTWRRPDDPVAALHEEFLPGRFQQIARDPDWRCDTAHNSEALCSCLDAFLERPVAGRRVVLFGCMRDKDLAPQVGRRLAACDRVVSAPIGLSRSRNRDELTALHQGWGLSANDRNQVMPDLDSALRDLSRSLAATDSVLVTGSCFLVAEVLYMLGFRDLLQTRPVRPATELLAPFSRGTRNEPKE